MPTQLGELLPEEIEAVKIADGRFIRATWDWRRQKWVVGGGSGIAYASSPESAAREAIVCGDPWFYPTAQDAINDQNEIRA